MERGLINKLNINCIVSEPSLFKVAFDRAMQICVESGAQQVEFSLMMTSLSVGSIKKVIDIVGKNEYLKAPQNDSIITFVITTRNNKRLKRIISPIKNNLVRIELVYDENDLSDTLCCYNELLAEKVSCVLKTKGTKYQQIVSDYDKMGKSGISILAEKSDMSYKEVSLEDFEKWAYDKNGGRLSLFSDFVTHIILDYWGSRCKHKSCLTKYFTINCDDGMLYSCKDKINPLGNIFEFNSMDEIFHAKGFIELLQVAIEKRNLCKKECEFFSLCQGGCPNENYNVFKECDERGFFLLYKGIEEKLWQIVRQEDYRELNPALAEIILFGAASNKLFEKGDSYN